MAFHLRFAVALAACASALELQVEHAFGAGAPFSLRGSLLEVTPAAPKSKLVKVVPETLAIVGENATKLAALLAADGFYQIRARSPGCAWATASIRACDLARAGYAEALSVSLSARGEVVALAFANGKASAGGCADLVVPEGGVELVSSAVPALDAVVQVVPVVTKAAKPPSGMGEVLRDGGAGGAGAGGGARDPDAKPKGLLARYWHVLLPLALVLLTTKEPEEPAKKDKAPAPPAAAK